ncbi:hypothetical protein [Blastococcus sp. URHD0036]|uniref:hypothetical protein n=1 Tax=Blastococcus sp. URHD0036 TaxID=1380356 RepID=UPI000495714C|nr:hypothetical protein [Blastococcus sp. URHD0036]
MTVSSGAWIQSPDEEPSLILRDGTVVQTQSEEERQHLVQAISRVTSGGSHHGWPDATTAYVLDSVDGGLDVVVESPLPDATDHRGRRVMTALILQGAALDDVSAGFQGLRQQLERHGVSLSAVPEDFDGQLRGLVAQSRRGCLVPISPNRRRAAE